MFLTAVSAVSTGENVDFNRDVRPVLSDRCYACHGPDATSLKGELRLDLRDRATVPAASGATAIVPGRPDQSELVRRLGGRNSLRYFAPPALVTSIALSVLLLVLQLTGVVSGLASRVLTVVHAGPALYALVLISGYARPNHSIKESLILATGLAVGSYFAFVYALNLQFPVWPAFLTA